MNRTIAILAAIVVVIAVWYFGFRSQPEVAPEATTTTETTTAPAAPATTTETTTTAPATTTETTTAPAATTETTTTAPATTTETTTAPAATTETTTTAPAGDIAALLDPATFDADKLIAAVDTSTLDDATKATLKAAIEGARNNPGAVQAVIDQVKAAMGM